MKTMSAMRSGRCAAAAALLTLGALCPAAADDAPGDCFGVDFDRQHPVAIGKITAAKPRVYFVKSISDNAACPADTESCQETAYLIPGNLVMLGKKNGAYACVSYESAQAKTPRWTNGWLPGLSLSPVAPAPAPARADWNGDWRHASGAITIANGANGTLTIHGEAFYQAAQDVHTGVIDARAKPVRGLLEFADDGSVVFDKASADSCLVRMQRVEAFLVVEDNGNCGGALVTFTGFYRRK